MKIIVKEHPLRPIVLRFDTTKQPPEFEKEALDAYYAMHDKTWETKQNLLTHKDSLYELDVQITELEYRLLPIEHQVSFLEAGFKLVDNVELPPVDKDFSIGIGEFRAEVNTHITDMQELYKDLMPEWKWFDNWADFIYDHEDWCAPGDNELIHQVYRRYEEVSVDIVSLDRDQQEFFGAHGEVRQLQRDYFAYGKQVFDMYNDLNERAEKVYKRANRVNEYVIEKFD
ncbi:hypothetical protein G5B30_02425 [Sphingobacterium sp. SGG-5]|uniref:hypothetical protein n=1 Tax=Sphingobacterium sp. SGG-5 TaxID=2710881 RepID=UPI0013EC1D7F|nr:hypothetical protein [Sphingobacterium sp. SGG-5]NGM60765.1 hypothetical protein [Sphingobacterium sp. SGG-5]